MRDQHSANCKPNMASANMRGSIPVAAPSRLLQYPNSDYGLSANSFSSAGNRSVGDGHCETSSVGSKSHDRSPSVSSAMSTTPKVSVSIRALVRNMHMAVDAIPKKTPVSIALYGVVPPRIVTDDIKVLRCALNLLEHCASISSSGSILLSIQPQYCCCGKSMLRFHCVNVITQQTQSAGERELCPTADWFPQQKYGEQ